MNYSKLIPGFIICCLLISTTNLYAQVNPDAPKTTTTIAADTLKTVEILGAKKLQIKRIDDTTQLQILAGDVRLKQGTTLFYCDSCIINNSQHIFEAFGKVHINDSDTINIYSDYLKYLTVAKIAHFNGNVKLTDGRGVLMTPEMDYDMNTKIGTYTKGGKVLNKKSVLTSDEGYYYADLKDVYFKKNVVLKDPAYDLKADSLLYSTAFETVRFITKTVIVDSNKRTITTSEGFYDLKNGKAEFGKRPLVQDGKVTIIANRIAFDDSTGISQAQGNAIIVDTSQGTTIIGGTIFRNRKTEAILATQKPLMIVKQENDSIYITADTLFSARLTDLYSRPESFKKDSVVKADTSISSISTPIQKDSTQLLDSNHINTIAANTDTLFKKDIIKDSILEKSPLPVDTTSIKNIVAQTDTTIKNSLVKTADSLLRKDSVMQKPLPPKESLVITKPVTKKDSVAQKTVTAKKPGVRLNAKKKNEQLVAKDSTVKKDTLHGVTTIDIKENDSTNRYFEAYRHVRIFSDSLQAAGDSIFYSFHDSTFRLFYEPVIWAKGSQITGDTIFMVTKNKKPDRLKVINNSLLVNSLEKDAYNQIKSTRMDAYFVDGNIDSVRAKGSAECIYYLQDKDSAYTGINQSQSDIMDIYFRAKELHRVVFRNQVKGTIWPIRQKTPSEMRLPNFKWLEARRPKTKFEMFE